MKINKMSDNTPPALRSTSTLSPKFPDMNEHIDQKQGNKTRNLLQNTSTYDSGGRLLLDNKSLPHLLATDAQGANRFYNDLGDEEKVVDGDKKYASASSVQKELSDRVQEPRDSIQKERYRDTEECIKSLRDSPELEKIREVEESKLRKDQKRLKERKMKAEQINACQATGEDLLPNAEAHHIERRADKPRKAGDLANIAIVNPEAHAQIHMSGVGSEQEFSQFAIEEKSKREQKATKPEVSSDDPKGT